MPRIKPHVLFLVIGAALVLVGNLGANRRDEKLRESEMKYFKTFSRILQEVQDKYVEPITPEKLEKMFHGAYRGMLSTLDPYTEYYDQQTYADFRADTEGKFGGLGIEIIIGEDGWLTVVTPIVGTPAYHAGVRPGDKIIRINGESTEGLSIMDAVHKLRGKPKTKVTITVVHPHTREVEELTITREIIEVNSVDYRMLDLPDDPTKIGYIQISSFREDTARNLRMALKDLEQQGMQGLVLDLRNNPGGLLSSAVEVSDEFIKSGVIVSTRGRNQRRGSEFFAHPNNLYEKGPMVVLVNGGSASGAEIVAGALKDHGRAVLVGQHTFGKGSVQTVIQLEKGKAALKLTTARYYTPAGHPIKFREGVKPDIQVAIPKDAWKDLIRLRQELHVKKNFKKEAQTNEQKEKNKLSDLPPVNGKSLDQQILDLDTQLQRAVDALKILLVYERREKAETN